jgi:hypothetical protein
MEAPCNKQDEPTSCPHTVAANRATPDTRHIGAHIIAAGTAHRSKNVCHARHSQQHLPYQFALH